MYSVTPLSDEQLLLRSGFMKFLLLITVFLGRIRCSDKKLKLQKKNVPKDVTLASKFSCFFFVCLLVFFFFINIGVQLFASTLQS